MTRDQLQARTKKELAELARKKGVAGWHTMRKEDLVEALAPVARGKKKKQKPARVRPQTAAARNTSEQEVESSKYNVDANGSLTIQDSACGATGAAA